jgi:hypothetical protein
MQEADFVAFDDPKQRLCHQYFVVFLQGVALSLGPHGSPIDSIVNRFRAFSPTCRFIIESRRRWNAHGRDIEWEAVDCSNEKEQIVYLFWIDIKIH